MKQQILVLILLLLQIILISTGANYYKLLGVNRNANDQQLRRAFKKLSLKYHPDKNKQNPQEAQKKFQEIANAYEVLKDPEQRKIYDQYGEKGIKENLGRQQQHQGQDMWSHFFQQSGQQQAQNYFQQTDVFQLDMANLKYFYRRSEVWLVFFFKSGERRTHKHIDLVKQIAQKFYGSFKVASVDCDSEDVLCEDEFQVYTYPQFMVYESNINIEGVVFQKDISMNSLVGFTVSKMENFVRYLSEENYDDFKQSESQNDKVILITKQKVTPPLFKALSKDLRGKLSFGLVRHSDNQFFKKFNVRVDQLPLIMILQQDSKYEGEIYSGKMNKDQILSFLRPYAYKERGTIEKIPKIQLMTSQLSKQSGVCAKNDKNYCYLVIYEPDQHDMVQNQLKALANKYIDEAIQFYYVLKNNIAYENIFEGGDQDEQKISKFPATVVIRGKRNKFTVFQGNQDQISSLESFVDDILGGGQTYYHLEDNIWGNVFDDQMKQDL